MAAGDAQVPHGAAGYYLLGRICRLTSRQRQAVQYFASALALDNLLWCAYEELCILGAPKARATARRVQHVSCAAAACAGPRARVHAGPSSAAVSGCGVSLVLQMRGVSRPAYACCFACCWEACAPLATDGVERNAVLAEL